MILDCMNFQVRGNLVSEWSSRGFEQRTEEEVTYQEKRASKPHLYRAANNQSLRSIGKNRSFCSLPVEKVKSKWGLSMYILSLKRYC